MKFQRNCHEKNDLSKYIITKEDSICRIQSAKQSEALKDIAKKGQYEELLNQKHVNCTLSSEGHFIRAHSQILIASSCYFSKLIKNWRTSNEAIIQFHGIPFMNICLILKYIYTGHVSMAENRLESFLEFAETMAVIEKDKKDLMKISRRSKEIERKNMKTMKTEINSTFSTDHKSYYDNTKSQFQQVTIEIVKNNKDKDDSKVNIIGHIKKASKVDRTCNVFFQEFMSKEKNKHAISGCPVGKGRRNLDRNAINRLTDIEFRQYAYSLEVPGIRPKPVRIVDNDSMSNDDDDDCYEDDGNEHDVAMIDDSTIDDFNIADLFLDDEGN
ncbi:CLUMA_CG007155, isoform A [Clunio marinus]|uniref:CLUMA_CG007155, isoform A n=1 Tax=Clunio marinus TaxID=568069 RepID=A0A1J1I5H3_9DIPT|nr:CLUMA_CG007155, isoform A [Clunio marinus]